MIYINQNFSQFLSLSLLGSSYTEFRVGTSTPTAIVVDWGDGSITSYSGDLMTIYHTYSSPFTGNMKISCPSGNNLITSLNNFSSSNTLNSIAFTTAQLSYFTGLETFECLESNIISGDIANLPLNLIVYINHGLNTTSGDIANLPLNLNFYENQGLNTTSGDIANLPLNLNFYENQGLNTTSGDIANIPSGLLTYANIGNNTTSGDIANLPLNLIVYINKGLNTTSGDIANIPSGLLTYANIGNNTTSGDIANLPLNLIVYINHGLNTTSGDIANLPLNLNFYENQGNSTVVDYTSPRVWSNNMSQVLNRPTLASGGLTSTEVDNLLIDLSSVSIWTPVDGFAIVDLSGNNKPRTYTSDTAVAILIAKGVTVITN